MSRLNSESKSIEEQDGCSIRFSQLRQIQYEMALNILISLLKVRSSDYWLWMKNSSWIVEFYCGSCKWRKNYYLQQLTEFILAIKYLRNDKGRRWPLLAFLKRILYDGVIQHIIGTASTSQPHQQLLCQGDQQAEKHTLIEKISELIKIFQPLNQVELILLYRVSFKERLNSDRILSQLCPERFCDDYAVSLCQNGQMSQALTILKREIQTQKEMFSDRNYDVIGDILGCMGDETEAFKNYKIATKGKITKIGCLARLSIAIMKYKGIDMTRELIKKYQSCISPVSFHAFKIYFQEMSVRPKFFAGLKRLKALTKWNQNNPSSFNFLYLLFYIGIYYFHSFRFEKSLRYIKGELREHKNSRFILEWTAICCDQLQQYELEIMNRIEARLLPQISSNSFLLAIQIYSKLGQYDKAIQYFTLFQPSTQITKTQAMITMVVTYQKLENLELALYYYHQIQVKQMCPGYFFKQFQQIIFLLDFGFRHTELSKRKNLLYIVEDMKYEMILNGIPGAKFLQTRLAQRGPFNIDLMLLY